MPSRLATQRLRSYANAIRRLQLGKISYAGSLGRDIVAANSVRRADRKHGSYGNLTAGDERWVDVRSVSRVMKSDVGTSAQRPESTYGDLAAGPSSPS